MSRNVSIAEAKAHFSECIREVEQGESVLITRHGKAVAALVAATDLDQLKRLRRAGPQSGLASLSGGWEGSEELAQHIKHSTRTQPRGARSLD